MVLKGSLENVIYGKVNFIMARKIYNKKYLITRKKIIKLISIQKIG